MGNLLTSLLPQEIVAESEPIKTKLEAVIEERDKEVSILQADLESEKVAWHEIRWIGGFYDFIRDCC